MHVHMHLIDYLSPFIVPFLNSNLIILINFQNLVTPKGKITTRERGRLQNFSLVGKMLPSTEA